jgi:hypothetical protein
MYHPQNGSLELGNTYDSEVIIQGTYTVVPPYQLMQYPQFQLSMVYRGSKKILKIKEMVHKFQNVCQARMGRNVVKSSSPNVPST